MCPDFHSTQKPFIHAISVPPYRVQASCAGPNCAVLIAPVLDAPFLIAPGHESAEFRLRPLSLRHILVALFVKKCRKVSNFTFTYLCFILSDAIADNAKDELMIYLNTYQWVWRMVCLPSIITPTQGSISIILYQIT